MGGTPEDWLSGEHDEDTMDKLVTEDGDVRYWAVMATNLKECHQPIALPRLSVTKEEALEACRSGLEEE